MFSVDAVKVLTESVCGVDVLLCHKPSSAYEDQLRYLKRLYKFKIIMWTPDYRQNQSWDWYETVARVCDLTVATDGDTECQFWDTRGIENATLRQACDPRLHFPVPRDHDYAVGFLGSLYTPFRQHVYDTLRKEFGASFLYHGKGNDVTGEVWGRDFQKAIASCQVIVGDNYVVAPGYWSDRVYLTTACGGFFLAPDDPALRAEFGDAIGYYAPKDVQDLVKQIRVALADPEREARAKAAQVLTHSQHTYAQRIARLLEMIRGLK